MARRSKKIKPVVIETPKFYVYFNYETKKILSVTNEKHPIHEHFVEINDDDYEQLVSGSRALDEFCVDYIEDGVFGLVSIVNEPLAFNNTSNRFITVRTLPESTQEFLVEWHGPTKHWIFSMTEFYKEKLFESCIPKKLEFYIILENDYDLLIRTIVIDTSQVVNESVYIPFETNYEHSIDAISVATKSVFKSYRLDIIHE